jgi:hypothetical protein
VPERAREFPNFALTASTQIYATQWLHHYATCELRARNQGNAIEKKFGRKSRPCSDVFYTCSFPFLIMTSLVRNLCLLLEGAADIFAHCINYNSREYYTGRNSRQMLKIHSFRHFFIIPLLLRENYGKCDFLQHTSGGSFLFRF